jgi:hypothetical protein
MQLLAADSWQRWHGAIDELRIYSRALTPGEIQQDMNKPL